MSTDEIATRSILTTAKTKRSSDSPHLRDLIANRLSRRSVLGGGIAAAATTFLPTSAAGAAAAPVTRNGAASRSREGKPESDELLGFQGVPTSTSDTVVVADGYVAEVLIPWGTPLQSGGPDWKKDGSNTAAEQAEQVGFNHDGMWYYPLGDGEEGNGHGLLVVNHEYTDASQIYADDAPLDQEKVDKALAAHGVTVIEISEATGRWRPVDSTYNRRITGSTPMTFDGPLAGSPALESSTPPVGTLNNCANGHTPWNTYLICEENWNGYFGTADVSFTPNEVEESYGLEAEGFGYGWHTADPRFDIAVNRKEPNRFGYVVEFDPFDPSSVPVKHTALGRFKHEGALAVEARRDQGNDRPQIVVYSGDDETDAHVYKYVSTLSWKSHMDKGESPLANGTLYVAKFKDDGSGEWLPIVHGEGELTSVNGWTDQADVILRTRLAAAAMGATEMDRPEWITYDARTGDMYMTLTNGGGGSGAANPREPNPYGHIIRWREDGDATALTFAWDIFVLAGDPAHDPAVTIQGDIFGSPDGIWVDDDGRLWIETDISNSSQNLASRQYENIGNNQMLAADPTTGEIRRFLTGPRGCELTGVTATPDGTTLFVNIQHPGESTAAWGEPTTENPRSVSNWPDYDPAGRPRSATLAIRKIGGGKIGS